MTGDHVAGARPLRATVRLQFHTGFTLDDATALVPYFEKLGISHVYASPLLAPRPGSTHGYDTLDYGHINPAIGGMDALRRLCSALHARNMGLIVDIVPNHMAVGGEGNLWWEDVLAWGRSSRYSNFFDIDWNAPGLDGKILAPFLDRPYGDALHDGMLVLRHDAASGFFFVHHHDNRFPICPDDEAALMQHAGSIEDVLARHDCSDAAGRNRLHKLLERQAYRLAWWRSAADLMNWRRFFDITGLGALCVEHADVFDAVHALVIGLQHEGLIDGLRIDHIDGLAAPAAYCHRLRAALAGRPALFVEKILGAGEKLRRDWDISGTSGYEFMDRVSAVLHDVRGAKHLDQLWQEAGEEFSIIEETSRVEVLAFQFHPEFAHVVRLLAEIAAADRSTRDHTPRAISDALHALLLHFPVYRTYFGDEGCTDHAADRAVMSRAAHAARQDLPEARWTALAFVVRALSSSPARPLHLAAQQCFEHLTAPLAAKSVEDKAFYRFGRLLSRNEVGSDPAIIAMPVASFHQANLETLQDFPAAMLATATHDHKRGEDSRARIAVLSEAAGAWRRQVAEWSAQNAALRRDGAPDRADELMLYQSLLGAWPLMPWQNEEERCAFRDRMAAWQMKALREAARHTRWTAPDERYEAGCAAFLDQLLAADSSFPAAMAAFVEGIAAAAAVNSLAQTLLRLTSPGIPDLYQGTELWDFSLVDPDNRRPVDFALRARMLEAGESVAKAATHWRDGEVKLALIRSVLNFRASHPDLFTSGSYEPVSISGPGQHHAIAFTRRHATSTLLVVTPRHSWRLHPDLRDLGMRDSVLGGCRLDAPQCRWRDVLHPGHETDDPVSLFREGAPVLCLIHDRIAADKH